jgi:hypothetical protein
MDGGPGFDEALAVAVNAAGEAFVLIDPDESGMPLQNPVVGARPPGGDAILAKYSAQGAIAYSTYIGFGVSNTITGNAIAVGPDGLVYVTGEHYNPTERMRKLVVAVFDPATGRMLRALDTSAGFNNSHGSALAINAAGTIAVTGVTYDIAGNGLPVTANAAQAGCGRRLALGPDRDCDWDAFVLTLNPDLSVRYASYLGGNGEEQGRGVAISADGSVVVGGITFAGDFPLVNALQNSCTIEPITGGCPYDGFISRFAPNGSLAYSSYLSSTESDSQTYVTDVALDSAGNTYIYGFSNGAHLPMRNALQPNLSRGVCLGGFDRFCFDSFLLRLTPAGALDVGTYLGGALDEYSGGMALAGNRITLVGATESSNFPIGGNPVQPVKSLNKDFFVAQIGIDGAAPPPPPPPPGPYRAYLPLMQR